MVQGYLALGLWFRWLLNDMAPVSASNNFADLDKYQLGAVKSFKSSENVAVLGEAGTGKSFLLARVIALAKERHGHEHVAACAVTNNAARNIGGTTLHRLFRAKINWEWSADGLWFSLQSRTSFQRSLLDIHTLIIDEISTVKGSILDAIDAVLRRFPRTPAQRDEPFGGRQIAVSGDPFELQPFFDVAETNTASALLSRSWEQCFGSAASARIVILSANHRQASDDCFYSMLSRVRKGRQTDKDLQTLNESCSASTGSLPPSHTRLVLTNEEAADINLKALRKLEGSVIKMHACDKIFTKNPYLERQAHARLAHTAPKTIPSKVGARVILVVVYTLRALGPYTPFACSV